MRAGARIAGSMVVLLILSIIVVALPTTSPGLEATGLRAVHQEQGYLILEGDEQVLFYQRAPKSLDGKYARANYVHPLYGLDGNILTEDFPADHPHHRGIFWAWHQVNIGQKRVGDSWETRDLYHDVTDVSILNLDSHIMALKAVALWKSPNWRDAVGRDKPFVRETTTISVHTASSRMRKIDFHIHLAALEEGVSLGGSEDEKGYGGFSARIRLPENVRFTGRDGAVVPKLTAVPAGPWIDLTGHFGNSSQGSGVAILSHPSLPIFPPPWILRAKASMQNAVFPGRSPVPLARQKPIDLRYRMIIHRGDSRQAGIDRLQAAYERE